VKKEKKQSQSSLKLINTSAAPQKEPEAPENDKTNMQLIQVMLPQSNPGDVPIWGYKDGNITVSIKPGWDSKNGRLFGYPFGFIPRQLLFWMTTEALRTGSRRIELGLYPHFGGKREDAKIFYDQMECLFRAAISLENTYEDGKIEGKRWLDMLVASEYELYWDFKNPEKSTLFGSWVELGKEFYQAIISAPIPMDTRALIVLNASSLAFHDNMPIN